jgi:hypothetical protein
MWRDLVACAFLVISNASFPATAQKGSEAVGPACVLYKPKNNAQLPVALSNATIVRGSEKSFGVWRITEGSP